MYRTIRPLRAMYAAAKSDKIQSVRLQAHRSVTVLRLLLLHFAQADCDEESLVLAGARQLNRLPALLRKTDSRLC